MIRHLAAEWHGRPLWCWALLAFALGSVIGEFVKSLLLTMVIGLVVFAALVPIVDIYDRRQARNEARSANEPGGDTS